MTEIFCSIICVVMTIPIILHNIRVLKMVNRFKQSDSDNHSEQRRIIREFYSSVKKFRDIDHERIIDLGVRLEKMEKNMDELEKHVFVVMKSTLYGEK